MLRLRYIAWLLVCSVAYAADTTPPTVSISSPANGATLIGYEWITATASDDVAVASVQLLVDGAIVAIPTSAPYRTRFDTRTVPNGQHSLLAIAIDSSGNYTRSSLVTVTVTNSYSKTQAAGPYNTGSLGGVFSANSQEHQVMFRDATYNNLHLILYYDVTSFNLYTNQILDCNLTQGTNNLVWGVLGRPGPMAQVLYYNDKFYMASSDPGYLVQYDVTNGTSTVISALNASPTTKRFGQMMEIGDDGWVYVGEFSEKSGGVGRYNPNTATFQDLGLMDPAFNSSQYSYSLGADTRYVYVGLGELPWYLAIYDTVTTNITLYWKANNDLGGNVYHGNDGNWYYWRKDSGSAITWYGLTNGAPVLLGSVPSVMQNYQRGRVINDATQFGTFFNEDVNLDSAYPSSLNNSATVLYRTIGAPAYASTTATNFLLQPVSVQRLYPWATNNFIGFSSFYGPVFTFDPATSTAVLLGQSLYNLYSTVFEYNRVFFSGYTAATINWDTTQPWTLAGSVTNKYATNINPYLLHLQIGKYHRYTTFGADGMLYVASENVRSSDGGELGWWDPMPQTNNYISMGNTFGPRDLKPVLGATKVVYSCEDGNLYTFDTATKALVNTNTPLGGFDPDKIIEVQPGIVFGASSNIIYLASVTNSTVIYSNNIPALAFGSAGMYIYNHNLVLGPDGNVWMFMFYLAPNKNVLTKINPLTGSYQNVLTNGLNVGSVATGDNSIMLVGNDMFLFGGTTNIFDTTNLFSDIPTLPFIRVVSP